MISCQDLPSGAIVALLSWGNQELSNWISGPLLAPLWDMRPNTAKPVKNMRPERSWAWGQTPTITLLQKQNRMTPADMTHCYAHRPERTCRLTLRSQLFKGLRANSGSSPGTSDCASPPQ